MRESKNNKKQTYVILSTLIAAVFLIIAIFLSVYLRGRIQYFTNLGKDDSSAYNYHYAMIVSDSTDEFWSSVYAGALAKAEENNAYIELFGSELNIDYSEEALMEMAISAGVDGIIVEPNGSYSLNAKINKAISNNIPVVTILNDASISDRISFVGVSNYNLGHEYADQIIDIVEENRESADKDKYNVMVLMNGNVNDASQNMMYVTIQEALNDQSEIASIVNLQPKTIRSISSFDAEEAIRNIFLSEEELPDIFLCLDEMNSACVYQALVDYIQVGNVELIGYYTSDNLISGISKDIVHSTIGVDTREMGILGVEALTEYITTGYVSDYYSVDTFIVNKDNVSDFLAGGQADD